MKRGFTLVELMVTAGLLGLLATISTVGYYAAVRGMTDRGVEQNVTATLNNAAQRALMDDRPVVVFIYDENIREESDDGFEEDVTVGRMVAVRMAGRISYVNGDYIVDEFADWNASTYPIGGKDNSPSMRLYRIAATGEKALESLNNCRSFVADFIEEVKKLHDPLLTVGQHADSNFSPASFQGATVNFAPFYGFKVRDGYKNWQVGDAYGFEIASLTLPHGYRFSSGGISKGQTSDIKQILFNPATVSPQNAKFTGWGSVQIYAVRPGKTTPVQVGKAISDLGD